MKKYNIVVNIIPQTVFGMDSDLTNNYIINCENININNIINENKNDKKHNLDNVYNILGKDNISYDEYKLLLEYVENNDHSDLNTCKILETIEKDNIIRLADIKNIIETKGNEKILRNKIEEDEMFINGFFWNNFFYKFSDNVDLHNIYIIIHTIRLILQRNLNIREIIIRSLKCIKYSFILSDYKGEYYLYDKIEEVLKKYKMSSMITFLEKIFTKKVKEFTAIAFFETYGSFFTINYFNEFLVEKYREPKSFVRNAKKN